jgi:hypothetical protein
MWFMGVPEKPPTTIMSINKYIYFLAPLVVVLVSSGMESIGSKYMHLSFKKAF